MNLRKLENENNKNVRLFKVSDNHWYNPHFFIRKYRDNSSTLHMHEYIQINYILEGKGTHYINNNSFDITKGDIFVIPPYIPHYITFKPRESFMVIEFEFDTGFINEAFHSMDNIYSLFDFAYIEPFLVSESQVKPRLNLVGREQLEIEEILEEVYTEYTEKKTRICTYCQIIAAEASCNCRTSIYSRAPRFQRSTFIYKF